MRKPFRIDILLRRFNVPARGIRGAAFDPAGGRLFITEDYGESPVVHVYRIEVR